MCAGADNLPPVGSATLGKARWDQFDLAGGLWEWTLDSSANIVLAFDDEESCKDCVHQPIVTERIVRGGHFEQANETLESTHRKQASTSLRYVGVGFRCARPP